MIQLGRNKFLQIRNQRSQIKIEKLEKGIKVDRIIEMNTRMIKILNLRNRETMSLRKEIETIIEKKIVIEVEIKVNSMIRIKTYSRKIHLINYYLQKIKIIGIQMVV